MAAPVEVTISLNPTLFNRTIGAVKQRLESMFLTGIDQLSSRNTRFTSLGDRWEIYNFVDAILNMFTVPQRTLSYKPKTINNTELKQLVNQILPDETTIKGLVFNQQVHDVIRQEVTIVANNSDVMLSNETYSPFLFLVSVDDGKLFIDILIDRVASNLLRYYKNLLNDYRLGINDLKDGNHRPGNTQSEIHPHMLSEDVDNLTKQLKFNTP